MYVKNQSTMEWRNI